MDETAQALPATTEACRARMAMLRDEIAAIKAQIAAADLDRQARRTRLDPRWFHRAKTALRHKQRELEALAARQATLARQTRDRFKDCLIAVVRADYDEEAWQAVLDETRRRLASQA